MFLVFGGRVCYTEFTKDTKREAISCGAAARYAAPIWSSGSRAWRAAASARSVSEGGQPLSPDQLRAVLLNRQFLDQEEDGYSDPFHGPMKPDEYED